MIKIKSKEFSTFIKVKKILFEKAVQMEISLSDIIVLYYLYEIEEAKIKDLIQKYAGEFNLSDKAMQLKKIRITQITNNLVAKGLITKNKDKKDKRAVVLKITSAGKKLIEE